MTLERAVSVAARTPETAFAEAERMSEWLTDYLLMDDASAQTIPEPECVPELSRSRLVALFGERPVAEQLQHTRTAYQALQESAQYNAFLYVAGYSQRAIQLFGDEAEELSIKELFRATAAWRRELGEQAQRTALKVTRVRKTGASALAAVQPRPVAKQAHDDIDESETRQGLAWQVDALCAQTDPEAFFPEKGGSTRDAKRICASCDVRGDCLEYALGNDERFGVWGGLSERERRKLKHRN